MSKSLHLDSLEIYEQLTKDFGEDKAKTLSRLMTKVFERLENANDD